MVIQRLFFFSITCLISSLYCNQDKEFTMPSSPFTLPGDPLLQRDALEVPVADILSHEIQSIIDQMLIVASGERDHSFQKRVMVGLAAPQIGIQKRIILVDVGVDSNRNELGSLEAYINPEIIWYSDEIVEGREGCYSVDSRVMGIVPRSKSITMCAFDRNGLPVTAELSDFTARIFQHEVDHLNGIRFPDRVGPQGCLHWVESDAYELYKKNPLLWNQKCPWELWKAMKQGESYSSFIQDVKRMLYTIEERGERYFIGLELRTNNQECSATMPAHKERFFQENILEKIPHKVGSDLLALYTDYEGDYTQAYSWILGAEVSSLDEVPEGLVGKVIPASQYAVFPTQGAFPEGLIAAWQEVWKSDLSRLYSSDFELYPDHFDPQVNPEVKVYIAIEQKS